MTNPFEKNMSGGNINNPQNNYFNKNKPNINNITNMGFNNNINMPINNIGNKQFKKYNNNNINMTNGMNNNHLHKIKYVKSDKNLTGNPQSQNSYKNNNPNIFDQNNNKVWRNNNNNPNYNNNYNPNFMMNNNMNNINNNMNNNVTFKKSNHSGFNNSRKNFKSIKEEDHNINNNGRSSKPMESKLCDPNDDNGYFSSDHSDEEESVNKQAALLVAIKLNGKEETICISKNEKSDDISKIAKEFVIKHKLNENLVNPIIMKIKQAINSIDLILDHNISVQEHYSLFKVQNFYNQKDIEEEELFNLNLSCITDICSTTSDFDETLSLSNEDLKKIERLNISR